MYLALTIGYMFMFLLLYNMYSVFHYYCQEQPPTDDAAAHHQKTWDSLRLSSIADTLYKNTSDQLDRVRVPIEGN